MTPPHDKTDWLMLVIVGIVSLLTHLLKVAAKGGPWTPTGLIVQHLARSVLTGVVAAGTWSAIMVKFELPPTATVAVAVVVAMMGVDLLERLLLLYAQKKLGITDDKGGGA